MPAIDLEFLFRNNGRNRWGGAYVKFNEPTNKHEYGEEQTRADRNFLDDLGKWNDTPGGLFSYRRPKTLRHCREKEPLSPGRPQNQATKNRKNRNRGETQDSWIRFHGGFKNPNQQNVG